MDSITISIYVIVYPSLWNHQRTADFKHSILTATTDSLERFKIFKTTLKTKDYKSWFDAQLNSQEFTQHLSNRLQPTNMMAFIPDLAGLDKVNYDQLPTTVQIQTRDGKINAMIFKQRLTDVLSDVGDRLSTQVFSAY